MKPLFFLIIFTLLTSCFQNRTLNFNTNEIDHIEVYKGFQGNKVAMKEGFENELIIDLNKATYLGPTKYAKTHRILIYYKHKKSDTIYTSGIIHGFNGCYKSENNIIEKYKELITTLYERTGTN